jgi:hypothetical protein
LQIFFPHLRFELALPKLDDVPAHVTKFDATIQITFPIPFYLGFPKLRIRLRQDIISASFMSMPKASVNEDASTILLQHNIGRTKQSLHIDTETEAMCKKKFPYNHFRFRVLATDVCHAAMPLFGS